MNTIWVTGAGGLIGSALVATTPPIYTGRSAEDRRAHIIGLNRPQLDLREGRLVREAFRRDRPRLVIHCAAVSRSPDCTANPGLARQVNVETTALLADLAADIPFIFFSSDLVFDGRQGHYNEDACPNPLTMYAETKVRAEEIVLRNPNHTVIRTSLNGGLSPTGDRGFNEQLRRAWGSGRVVKLFFDEFRCPIAAVETARATWALVEHNATGIFHIAGGERLSRLEIGRLLAARWPQLNPLIEPTSLKDHTGEPRSPDTSLDCRKCEQLLGAALPSFAAWLAKQPEHSF